MRYFLITYYQRPNGQMDEVVSVANRLKRQDLAGANVILDFQTQSVLKCSMNGTNVPKEWEKIVAFYYEHYSATFERLFNENGIVLETNEKQDNPS